MEGGGGYRAMFNSVQRTATNHVNDEFAAMIKREFSNSMLPATSIH